MAASHLFRAHLEAVHQAARTIRVRPLRSALGVLAVAVAVATLALVETAIQGLAAYAEKSAARAFGSDTFVVTQVAASGQVARRELEHKLQRNPAIERADVRFLESYAGGRVIYAPLAQRLADVVAAGRKFENAAVCGTGAQMSEIRDLAIVDGRFFLASEERSGAQVAILGREVADLLFPTTGALGRAVRLGGRGFAVIGVQARLGTSGNQSLDRYVWIPLPAWERVYGAAPTLQISARPPAGGTVELGEDRARATMRALHRLAPGEEDDFDVVAPEAARGFVLSLTRRIGLAAPVLGFMALLAAVVVVTNTTLVSVSQRTFEIGVRRAVGATRHDIAREVLAESALVGMLGGTVGVAAVAVLSRALSGPLGLDLALRSGTLLAALAAALASGLAAGWYPARRAGKIDVVRALVVE